MYSTIYNDVVMEDLKEFYPDASDELLDELASDLYFGNRRLLMNTFADTIFPNDVICIADLGLWNGYFRYQAYRVYDAPTLDELFTSGQDIDEAEWYIDEYNDLCCHAHTTTTERIASCIGKSEARWATRRVRTCTAKYYPTR